MPPPDTDLRLLRLHADDNVLTLIAPIAAGEILVIEGWSPEFTIAEGLAEYQRHQYQELIVTGGPIEFGNSLIAYKTYAELGTGYHLALACVALTVIGFYFHRRAYKPLADMQRAGARVDAALRPTATLGGV